MDSQANEAILDGEPNDVKSSDLREDDDIINDKSHSHSSDGASAGFLSLSLSLSLSLLNFSFFKLCLVPKKIYQQQ